MLSGAAPLGNSAFRTTTCAHCVLATCTRNRGEPRLGADSHTGGVLMRTNDGGIHEVEVPVDLAALVRLGLQIRQDALPDPGLAPAVEPARHGTHRAIAPRQVTPRRISAM